MFYSLIGSLGPNLHFNDGMRDVVRLNYAPRTVTNADPPAPVSNYQMVNLELVDVILEALAHFNPARAIAHSGASSALSIAWSQGPAGPDPTCNTRSSGSAYGGGMGHDGATATATHLSNLHTTPIEILESEFPCRITRFDLVPDSGGAGRWRGGLAHAARIRTAGGRDRDPPLQQDAVSRRRASPAARPGRGARFVVRPARATNTRRRPRPAIDMKAGERFLLQSAGGGGYGDPPASATARRSHRDIAEGYVTADAAKTDYGRYESAAAGFTLAPNPILLPEVIARQHIEIGAGHADHPAFSGCAVEWITPGP